jgi:hypothetical protein
MSALDLPDDIRRRIFAMRIRSDHLTRYRWETLRKYKYIRNQWWQVYEYDDDDNRVIIHLFNRDNVVDGMYQKC